MGGTSLDARPAVRRPVYGRLAGYEDVNDADRLGRDPAMRWIVGGKAVERGGASTSQMGRFETELLANNENLAALADLSGTWIDRVHDHDPPRRVVLDMDSSVSPTFGEQEGTAYNGHFGCTCYHPLFVFNQFGDLERCALRPGNVHSAHGWRDVLVPVVERYKERAIRLYFRGDAAFASPEIYDPCAWMAPHKAPSVAIRTGSGWTFRAVMPSCSRWAIQAPSLAKRRDLYPLPGASAKRAITGPARLRLCM